MKAKILGKVPATLKRQKDILYEIQNRKET